MTAIFVNHIHTEKSNEMMDSLEGVWNYGDHNHTIDLLVFLENLDKDIDVVFNVTEHWGSGPDLFNQLEERVDELGGFFERFERFVCFEVEGRRAVVINSVECSVERYNKHFLLCGLPIDDEKVYKNISFEELMDAAETSKWAMPAHLFTPHYKLSDNVIEEFYEECGERGILAAVGIGAAYTPFFNFFAHGKGRRIHDFFTGVFELDFEEFVSAINPFRKSLDIRKVSEKFSVPVVSELDLHCCLPTKLDFAGVLEDEVVEKFFNGEFPTEHLLDHDLLFFEDVNGVSWKEFFKTFPGVLPLYEKKVYDRLLPYTRQEFYEEMVESCKTLRELDKEVLKENRLSKEEVLEKVF